MALEPSAGGAARGGAAGEGSEAVPATDGTGRHRRNGTVRAVRIEEENRRAGTGTWWGAKHAPATAIEGYATETSCLPGGRIELCVSTTPAARYEIVVYRLGWYDGDGGREQLRLPSNIGLSRSAPEPDPVTGIVRAGWDVSDVIPIAPDAVSGHWLAQLRLLNGPHAGAVLPIPFVVRPAPGDRPTVLVQVPVNTLQAYNHWGGKCLYDSNSTENVPAVKVSFDRPVPAWRESNLNSKAPFHYDLPLARWMEREGYDVAYQTDVDTHRAPWSLVGPRLVVTSGHDEYWTREMRDAFDAARDRGTCLAFMGANQAYWQIRYEDGERTIVAYKSASDDPEPDPTLKTVKFRQLEAARDEASLIGLRYERGLTKPDDLFDYVPDAAAAGDPWTAGADWSDPAPVRGVVGYEWDGLMPEDEAPPGLVRFLAYDGELGDAACIRWTAPSGARIFAAGSLGLVHALDDWARPGSADARVQTLVRNAFDDMTAPRAADGAA